MFLDYMTKEQQSHGSTVNFCQLPSRAESSGTAYSKCNVLVRCVPAMQGLWSPGLLLLAPSCGGTPAQLSGAPVCRLP